MLDGLSPTDTAKCGVCGDGQLRLLPGRVSKLGQSGGYINLFQCADCGEIEHRDIPHEPPGKRT